MYFCPEKSPERIIRSPRSFRCWSLSLEIYICIEGGAFFSAFKCVFINKTRTELRRERFERGVYLFFRDLHTYVQFSNNFFSLRFCSTTTYIIPEETRDLEIYNASSFAILATTCFKDLRRGCRLHCVYIYIYVYAPCDVIVFLWCDTTTSGNLSWYRGAKTRNRGFQRAAEWRLHVNSKMMRWHLTTWISLPNTAPPPCCAPRHEGRSWFLSRANFAYAAQRAVILQN